VIALLQIFSWFWEWNNFENRLIFGEVKAQKNGAIFGPPCRCIHEQWWLSGRQERTLSELFCAVLCTASLHKKEKCTIIWTVLGGSLGNMQMAVQSIAWEDSCPKWLISNYVPSGTLKYSPTEPSDCTLCCVVDRLLPVTASTSWNRHSGKSYTRSRKFIDRRILMNDNNNNDYDDDDVRKASLSRTERRGHSENHFCLICTQQSTKWVNKPWVSGWNGSLRGKNENPECLEVTNRQTDFTIPKRPI